MECTLHIFQQFTLCTNFATVWFSFTCPPNASCHYMALLCISAIAKCSSVVWMRSIFWSPTWCFHMICVRTLVRIPPSDGNINTCHMLSDIYIFHFPCYHIFAPLPHPHPNKIVAATYGGILFCVCVHAHACMHVQCVTPHSLYLKPLLTKQ